MPTDQEFAALKAEVARLTQLVENLYYRSGTPQPTSTGTPTVDAPPQDVVDAIRAGNVIQAIKLWRGYTGVGLREAKQQVEDLARRLGS